MPTQTPLFDYQVYPFPSPRYHQSSFAPAPSPSNSSLLPTPGSDSMASFASRGSWTVDSQHTPSEYDSPEGTAYTEYPFEHNHYSNSVASQSVGYPESSQRTHVAGSAYGSLYNPRFYGSTDASSVTSSRSPHTPPADESTAYRFSASPQHNASPHADSSGRGVHDSWQEFPDSPQGLPQYPRSGMMPPLQSQASALSSRSLVSSMPSQDSQSNFSRLLPRDSPRLSTFAFQSRLHGADGFDEPGNPSVVPPLVFDGEEYDDDSECSLPSAGSDVYRSTYQQSSQYSADESVGSSSAPGSRDGHAEGRSPTPPSESANSSPRSAPSRPSTTEKTKSGTQKKSKMHQCTVCSKWFPRPSGLATHMNSHSGAKPYKCPIPSCTKSFAVRSNAKRHLRTHGIFPTSEHSASPAQFTVGFDAPIISEVHEVSKLPAKLRWVPQSLATRTNVDFLRDAPSDSEDEYPPTCPVLAVPLPAVVPSSPKWNEEEYEDRNSYEDLGPSPYLNAHQWRALPGPAIVNPPSL